MTKSLKYLIYIWIYLLMFSCLAFAKSIEIIDLINKGKKYDGVKVAIEGEAIGHLMKRGDFAWVNINDNTASIGIWADYNLSEQIKYFGRHTVKGDLVRIYGEFQSHCPIHGGDTDIHAESMVIVEKGSPRQLTYDNKKVNILIFLTGMLLCLYIIKILKRLR